MLNRLRKLQALFHRRFRNRGVRFRCHPGAPPLKRQSAHKESNSTTEGFHGLSRYSKFPCVRGANFICELGFVTAPSTGESNLWRDIPPETPGRISGGGSPGGGGCPPISGMPTRTLPRHAQPSTPTVPAIEQVFGSASDPPISNYAKPTQVQRASSLNSGAAYRANPYN